MRPAGNKTAAAASVAAFVAASVAAFVAAASIVDIPESIKVYDL
jgi:hypothetical protein